MSDPRSDIDTGTLLTEAEHPLFRFEFDDPHLKAALASERIGESHGRLQLAGDLDLNGVAFPVLLRLRVVERADDRLLVVGTARLPYRLLCRATGFAAGRVPGGGVPRGGGGGGSVGQSLAR